MLPPRIIQTCSAAVGLAAMLLALQPAQAGIVNVQSSLATEAEEGLSGSITGSLDWRTGNSDFLYFSLAPVARYRSGNHLIIGILRGEYLPLADNPFISFEHLRYRYIINTWLLGETFVQHEFNKQKGLELRALIGLGPRFQVLDRERLDVAVGVAYMLEHERPHEATIQHRISSYVTGSFQIKDDLQLVETFYIQPRLTDPGDVRLLSESQIDIQVTKALSLKTSFVLAYDRAPPEAVESLDTALKSSVTYAF